jgi:YbbR domain-containing protein
MAWHPFRHIGLKIAALMLGTLLWMTVSGHQVERRILIPVSYSNVPAGLEMTSEQPDASVLVRGGDTMVSELDQGDLRVIVDLGDAHAGTNLIALRIDEVVAPLGIEVLQVEPGTVTVALEKSAQKDVPIEALVEGQPAAGLVVGEVVVDPKLVRVIGPESRLRDPISVVTERIVVDGRTATFTREVSVGVVDSQVRLLEPRRVRVVVQIEPERSAR